MKPATQDLATENQQIKHKSTLMSASEQCFLHVVKGALSRYLATLLGVFASAEFQN